MVMLILATLCCNFDFTRLRVCLCVKDLFIRPIVKVSMIKSSFAIPKKAHRAQYNALEHSVEEVHRNSAGVLIPSQCMTENVHFAN